MALKDPPTADREPGAAGAGSGPLSPGKGAPVGSAPPQETQREASRSPLRTPTSTHCLRSEGLGSQVRCLVSASERNIAPQRPPTPRHARARTPAAGCPRREQELLLAVRLNVVSHWAAREPLASILACYWPDALFGNVSLDQPGAGRLLDPPLTPDSAPILRPALTPCAPRCTATLPRLVSLCRDHACFSCAPHHAQYSTRGGFHLRHYRAPQGRLPRTRPGTPGRAF